MQEKYQFKVGDKVKYKESNRISAYINGHNPDEVYTIKMINIQIEKVSFEGLDEGWCRIERLELVPNNRHPHADLMIAYANDTSLKFQYREDEGSIWVDLVNPTFSENLQYRIKPKTITKYQVLYLMTKCSMVNVTGEYFLSEEDFNSAGYKDSKFIQLVKETAKEFEVQ